MDSKHTLALASLAATAALQAACTCSPRGEVHIETVTRDVARFQTAPPPLVPSLEPVTAGYGLQAGVIGAWPPPGRAFTPAGDGAVFVASRNVEFAAVGRVAVPRDQALFGGVGRLRGQWKAKALTWGFETTLGADQVHVAWNATDTTSFETRCEGTESNEGYGYGDDSYDRCLESYEESSESSSGEDDGIVPVVLTAATVRGSVGSGELAYALGVGSMAAHVPYEHGYTRVLTAENGCNSYVGRLPPKARAIVASPAISMALAYAAPTRFGSVTGTVWGAMDTQASPAAGFAVRFAAVQAWRTSSPSRREWPP